MKFYLNITLVGGLIGLPLISSGISRVGNGGLQSRVSQYSLVVPYEFMNTRIMPNDNARLMNINFAFSELKSIDLRNAVGEFPEIKDQSVDEIEKYLLNQNWKAKANHSFCGKLYYQESETAQAYLAIWGKNKGYVLIAQKTPVSEKYLRKLLNTTAVKPEACEW